MTTAREVPVTVEHDGDELEADDAWPLARRYGLGHLLWTSFVRFRYGDGFTNSRALALQSCLALVPFLLALTGLAADIDEERPAQVVAQTVQGVAPGSGQQDALASAVNGDEASEEAGELALGLGLVVALVSMTAAMAQVERGMNRIYGIRRDRRALRKYGRAAVMTAVLALPVGLGFLVLVAGGAFADAMADVYGWGSTATTVWNVARWPLGLALVVFAIAVVLDHAPRRRQPALSWLALGSGVSVLLSLAASGLLAFYVKVSGSFDDVYGPLAGVFALLVWSLMTSVSLFYGAAVCAQLEALRAGVEDPADDDPGRPREEVV